MSATFLKRVFMFNGERLIDIEPTMSPTEIRDFYALQYPELSIAAIVQGAVTEDTISYVFEKQVGTKG